MSEATRACKSKLYKFFQTNNGWSALFFAANEGDLATTKLLLKAGADPHLRDHVSSKPFSAQMQCQ